MASRNMSSGVALALIAGLFGSAGMDTLKRHNVSVAACQQDANRAFTETFKTGLAATTTSSITARWDFDDGEIPHTLCRAEFILPNGDKKPLKWRLPTPQAPAFQ